MTRLPQPLIDQATETVTAARLVAGSLSEARDHLTARRPMTGQALKTAGFAEKAVIDAFTLRFSKLQDMVVRHLLRLVHQVELADPPEAIIDLVAAAERRHLFPETADWMALRRARNGLTHDYPTDPERAAAALEYALEQTAVLLDITDRLTAYITDRITPAS